MLTNSHEQFNDHLKDAHESPLLTLVLKHHASHQEPYVTTHLPQHFGLQGVTVTTLTKITTSRSEIIVQRGLHVVLTRLKMLYAISYLRTLVHGIASIYRVTLRCFGTTLVALKPTFLIMARQCDAKGFKKNINTVIFFLDSVIFFFKFCVFLKGRNI